MKLPTGRRLVIAYVILSLVVSVAMPYLRKVPGERAVYQKAAVRFLAGRQFYRPDDCPAFTYPPFFVLPYVPYANLPDRAAGAAWYFTNFCLLGAVVWLTLRPARPLIERGRGSAGPRAWVPYVVLAVLSIRFLISPVEWQVHDLIVYLFATLAISAWAAGGDKAAGVWAGLAAACKATPLLFLPAFLRQRRLVAAAALMAALLAATFLPDLLRRNPDGQPWARSWYGKFVSKVEIGGAPAAQGAWWKLNPLNQSLSGTACRWFTPSTSCNVCLYPLDAKKIKYVTLGLQLAVLAAVLLATAPGHLNGMGREDRAFSTLGMGGVVLCGMLLLSPMSSKQHFCVLFTPLTFCVVDFFYRRRDPVTGTALAMCLVLGAAGKDILGERLYQITLAAGSLTLCTAVCLLASCYVIVRRARAAAGTQSGPQPLEAGAGSQPGSQPETPPDAGKLPRPPKVRAA